MQQKRNQQAEIRLGSHGEDYGSWMSNPVFYSRKANPYFELYDENGNYNYDYDIQNNTDKDLGFNIFEERRNA